MRVDSETQQLCRGKSHSYTGELLEVNGRLRVLESYSEHLCAEITQMRDELKTMRKHLGVSVHNTHRLMREKEALMQVVARVLLACEVKKLERQ